MRYLRLYHCVFVFFQNLCFMHIKSRHAMVRWTLDLFHQLQHALNMLYDEFRSR